jgi:hypothetical protein
MRRLPNVLDEAMVALFLGAVVIGHVMYFMADGLPSFLWRV